MSDDLELLPFQSCITTKSCLHSFTSSASATISSSSMLATTRANTFLFLVLLTIVRVTSLQHQHSHGGGSCITTERASLLSFKNGITSDPTNRLASWKGQDCCQWKGVKCNKKTNHVTKLQLRNQDSALDPFNLNTCDDVVSPLSGKISPSLLSLEYINHIDLSMNCLRNPSSRMPLFFASMRNLRHLNLSGIPFTGRVPPQFGNLSKLTHLDLSYNEMYSEDITWLTNLPFVQFLSMSTVNLTAVTDWTYVLNMLPSLRASTSLSVSLTVQTNPFHL